MNRSTRALISLTALCLFVGCATKHPSSGSNLANSDIENNSVGLIDADIDRQSELLHSYIKGNLALENEEPIEAAKNFEKASELSKEAYPELHEQLALLHLGSGQTDQALKEAKLALDTNGSVRNMFIYAGLLEAREMFSEAVPIHQQIIFHTPDQINNYILLASTFVQLKNLKEAVSLLRQASGKKPQELSLQYYLARTLELSGDLQGAETHMGKGYALRPETDRLAFDYMRLLLKRGKVNKAKEICKAILKRTPSNPLANALDESLQSGRKIEELLAILKFLENFETDPSDVRFKIAIAGIDSNDFETSALNLLFVIARNPENSKARYYLASIYASRGKTQAAVEQLLKTEQGAEMYVEARTLASFILKQDNQFGAAEKALRQALAERPDDQTLLIHLVDLLREQKKFDQALTAINKAIESGPANDRILFTKGIIYHDLGKERESERVMEEVIVVNPNHGQALNYIAYALADRNENLERAEELITKALDFYPEDGYFLDTHGWVLFKRGNYIKARESLERAVSLSGEDVVIREHYADCLDKVNEPARALEAYQTALSLARESKDKEERDSIGRLESKISGLLSRNPDLKRLVKK